MVTEEGTTPVVKGLWQAYNHGHGKRIWFLARPVSDGTTEYYWTKAGQLVRFLSMTTAQAAASRFNKKGI